MSLHHTQTALISVIFKSPSNNPNKAQNLQTASELIRNQGELTAEQRLGIYRGSVHGILTQALSATYPVCQALVGESFFSKMCSVFIDQSPPSSPYFHEYGDAFADFIQTFPPAQSLPYLSDMAHLEWARHCAWQRSNQTNSDFSLLANLSPEAQLQCQFQLPQSAQLLSSSYAVDALWQAHQTTEAVDFSQLAINEPCDCIIWRAARTIQQQPLNETQAQFLQAIKQQHTLAELATQFAEQLPPLLSEAIQTGWIHSFHTD
jgi:hypothetical protein